jgi:hypothetical protein
LGYFVAGKVIHGTGFAVNNSASRSLDIFVSRQKALKNEKNAVFLVFCFVGPLWGWGGDGGFFGGLPI